MSRNTIILKGVALLFAYMAGKIGTMFTFWQEFVFFFFAMFITAIIIIIADAKEEEDRQRGIN